ncbi:DUF397 domain-containing protein [Streptomyces sp. NPDC127039]|uniref:DUF397 domain-containing protein n=1 Tax=Streptomyces sp. NPDC127039 TaxID=3347115 RepID=UPI003653D3C7
MSDSHQESVSSDWFKSSYSGGNATECVECAHTDSGTLIRDSKRANSPVLHVATGSWVSFIRSLTHGDRPDILRP